MSWFFRNWTTVAYALWEHIAISLTALTIAFVLSLGIGIVAKRAVPSAMPKGAKVAKAAKGPATTSAMS